jgi:alpha-glucosidase
MFRLPASSKVATLLVVFGFCAVVRGQAAQTAPATRVASADSQVVIEFSLPNGTPTYRITYHGKPVVTDSKLGLEPGFTADFALAGSQTSDHAGQWTHSFGERRIVPDNYRQLDIDLKQSAGRLLRLTFRAYNEGAAFRYSLPAQETKTFAFDGEHTEFHFPPNTFGYEEHGTEGDYIRARIADFQPWCERPLTLELPDGAFASLNEAANLAYPRMLLSPLAGTSGVLVSALGGATANTLRGGVDDPHFKLAAGDSSPWRLLVLADSPGELLERSYLLLNLNTPSGLADTSWIHPGKAMRDTALTTASGKAIVDLALKLGLDYLALDAHWYGPDDNGDATQARAASLDLKEVIDYARQHKVAVCLYVDARQVKKQGDTLFPLFKSWGVDAVKVGFVTVGPQAETAWIRDVVAKAVENRLALNIHDGYRATGINRTYPNLLTVEGIRGNENFPTPEHNCTLPFTRYVGGVGDYTVCYLDSRLKTTHAHQLAMGVVSFSPLQWIYWYDKPAQLQNVPPEAEFWMHMPTVWDMTKVVNGQIGQYATIARQRGADWFVGTINNSQARTIKVPLAFLTAGMTYTAHLYSDSDTAATPTKVAVTTRAVDASSILDVELKRGGGQAIWIEAR